MLSHREQKDDAQGEEDRPIVGADLSDPEAPQLTLRAVVVGLVVGGMMSAQNTYFGLQTGWVTMGSLQSAILGYGIFSIFGRCGLLKNLGFSMAENVIVQTCAVAAATMPLAGGLVGIIPAFTILGAPEGPVNLSFGQLILWCLALAFIGVFIAVPLRTQTIVREQLTFPSGTATAKVIRTLHRAPAPLQPVDGLPTVRAPSCRRRTHTASLSRLPEDPRYDQPGDAQALEDGDQEEQPLIQDASRLLTASARMSRSGSGPGLDLKSAQSLCKADSIRTHCSLDSKLRSMQLMAGEEGLSIDETNWDQAWKALLWIFAAAGVYSLIASQVPGLSRFPVFTWIGLSSATAWGWELAPSLGYIGQGMIMGPRSAVSMLLGSISGYAILGPMARRKGWAPGPIMDWQRGAVGWILWISLTIMLADSLTSLALLCITSWRSHRARSREEQAREPSSASIAAGQEIPTWWWVGGLSISSVFCTCVLSPMLGLPAYEPLAAIILAVFVAVLAVRALGETDLNPVSGVGKLSQLVFAVIAPGRVVANLAAGAIAEAGAQQAGDMMQDFKTAYLLGVCPRAQFFAMLLGSGASVLVSVGAYTLFTSAYEVPGPLFPAPTAEIWLDMANLVNGGQLPAHVIPFCIGGAVFGSALPLLAALLDHLGNRADARIVNTPSTYYRLVKLARRAVPSGIGFAVGMYVAPFWTLPRVIGSAIEQLWLYMAPRSHASLMVIVASGLVLGEGTAAIISAIIKAIEGRPH